MVAKKNREGEEHLNKDGTRMKIIKYNNYDDIVVEFQDEYKGKTHTKYCHFIKGKVKNPYKKSVFGVGYIGEGKYSYSENKLPYSYWRHMLQRCYVKREKYKTYFDCQVCDEWLNFQNFAKWFYENYYEIEGETVELDKDFLQKGSKVYSPKTCIFIPHSINMFATERGNNYEVGKSGKYYFYTSEFGRKIHLGTFATIEEGERVLKKRRNDYLKTLVLKYKDVLPNHVIKGLYEGVSEWQGD